MAAQSALIEFQTIPNADSSPWEPCLLQRFVSPLASNAEQRRNRLRRPLGGKDVLELDAVGVRKENRVITGCVLGVLSRSVENGNSEIEEAIVKRVNCSTGRGREGEVMEARRVTIVRPG